MTVYILGGGPAGMALAHGLALEGGPDFVLLERENALGGLARTLTWDGHGRHDLGPHKLFTQDAALMQRVEQLLSPHDWLTREKVSRIYMHRRYLPYPPSPFSLIQVFGALAFARMTVGYAVARLRGLLRHPEPRTFAEDLRGRLGGALYEALFEPIALKLWGDPDQLDVKLSRGRVQSPKLREVIARLLRLRRTSEFEALAFRYPRGGLQRLWEAIREQAGGRSRFLTGREITRLTIHARRVTAIASQATGGGDEQVLPVRDEDFVVSTLPLGLLPRLMHGALSEPAQQRIREVVTLNDLLLVFLKVDRASLLPESWVFVPDPTIAFHRLSEQESFDPEMTPGGSIVCCEIMSGPARPLADCSDEALVQAALQGLQAMGYRGFRVLAQRVVRLPRSYPVFRPGSEQALQAILAELDAIENFRTVGRQGAFSYIGTLDAMDIGYGAARWLVCGRSQPWFEERERTRHYPVLD